MVQRTACCGTALTATTSHWHGYRGHLRSRWLPRSWHSPASHYDYVCAEVSKGIAQVGLESGLPVLFGVLTTDTIEQAIERAGTKAGNKGYDCAMSALEMVSLFKNA